MYHTITTDPGMCLLFLTIVVSIPLLCAMLFVVIICALESRKGK
jgi:hypothetical protein